MAASSRRNGIGGDQEAQGSHVESPTPHFFKVINGYSLPLGKIFIPKKFVRKYGEDLSASVTLKVPNGETWNIGLEEDEDGLWLQEGWSEFVRHYSVQENYLVAFCHEGGSVFRVVIYDKTTTEIEYPTNDTSPVRLNSRNLMSHIRLEAADFRSRYPFFLAVMTEYYVKRGSVAISVKFMTENKMTEPSQMVKLQYRDRLWPVKMYYYSSNGRGGSLCKGWIQFAKQNHIKVGDICVFELVKKNKVVFNVTVL